MNYESIPLDVNAEEPEFEQYVKVSVKGERQKAKSFPDSFEVTPVNEVQYQGRLGSCVGFACKESMSYFYPKLDLSALWIYKRAQEFDHKPGEDYSGTTITGACASLKKLGVCLEELYPYETRDLHETAFRDASTRTIEAFDSYRASSKTDIMNILMETERALPFSFRVHREFYTAVNTGFMVDESRYLRSDKRGGHASAILGWKTVEGKRYWVCRNSWGEKWGDDGKFYISFDLMEKISKGVFVVYQGDAPVGSGILSSVKVFFQSIFSAISKLLKRLQNKDK